MICRTRLIKIVRRQIANDNLHLQFIQYKQDIHENKKRSKKMYNFLGKLKTIALSLAFKQEIKPVFVIK